VSTSHDKFVLDSLFALQHAVGQMAGVSIKDLASEAKVRLIRSWVGVRLGRPVLFASRWHLYSSFLWCYIRKPGSRVVLCYPHGMFQVTMVSAVC
jgi:hypothetical protein